MIHLYTRHGGGRTARLQLALLDALRGGEQVVEIRRGRVDRLEPDGFGGIRRVPMSRRGSAPAN